MKLNNLKVALIVFGFTVTSFAAQAQAEQKGERKGPPSADKIIEKLDTDKDGKLSLAEVEADDRGKMAENFDKIDTDQDGFVSKEELETMLANRKEKRSK